MGNDKPIVVLSSCADKEACDRIVSMLLGKNLAACIQVQRVTSHYYWQGEKREADEDLLVIKTLQKLYPQVEKEIISLHNYEIPEIVSLPIENGFPAYLDWIKTSCSQE